MISQNAPDCSELVIHVGSNLTTNLFEVVLYCVGDPKGNNLKIVCIDNVDIRFKGILRTWHRRCFYLKSFNDFFKNMLP